MSAINVIVQEHSAHVITDGAKYSSKGVLLGFGSKCSALPHLPALFAVRGPNVLGMISEEIGSKFSTYDELIQELEVELEQFVHKHQHLWAGSGQSLIELICVGRSEKQQRFVAYVIRTEDANDAHIECAYEADKISTEPYVLLELPEAMLAPGLSPEQFDMVGFKFTHIENVDPIVDGRRLLEAQRSLKMPLFEGDEPTYHCGGFGVLSTVTREGTSQRLFHRFPDQVGQLINQNPITDWEAWRTAYAAEQAPVALSRLKREMNERKAKKQARR